MSNQERITFVHIVEPKSCQINKIFITILLIIKLLNILSHYGNTWFKMEFSDPLIYSYTGKLLSLLKKK